ncbi:hypothetical protein Gpo141_00002739 [Globisporangium polare]
MRKQEDPASAAQIHVMLDPMYKNFRSGGMSATNCVLLLDYLRKGATDANASKGVELFHEDSKEARTLLHRLISKHSSCFKTKTETRDSVQKLVVLFSDRSTKKRKRSHPEVYLQFVLQKMNTEHFACFEKLSRDLKRPLSAFTYAGIKDKAAITFQHVVVQGVEPTELLEVNIDQSYEFSGIKVGNLEFVGAPLGLGSANGNRFTIAIREIACDSDAQAAIAKGVETVKQRGFVNYFGFQRVGHPSHKIRPYHIGQQMLAGNWKEAVTLILTAGEREPESVTAAKRAYLDTGDVDAALKLIPGHMSLERSVLQGLKRYGLDAFDRAIENVSFSRRLMYMHAYQSFLFNKMASARLRLFGANLVEGDLVRDGDTNDLVVLSDEQARKLNEESENPLALVILPLVGTNARYPTNAIGSQYMELMEEHGTKAFLTETGQVKGSYRALVALPKDLEWSFESDAQLLRTSFSLPSGSFATMCLREILRSDM